MPIIDKDDIPVVPPVNAQTAGTCYSCSFGLDDDGNYAVEGVTTAAAAGNSLVLPLICDEDDGVRAELTRFALNTAIDARVNAQFANYFNTFIAGDPDLSDMCDLLISGSTAYPLGGEPVCDPDGPCLQFFHETGSATTACPDGRISHVCINGSMFCVGSGVDGGGGGAGSTFVGFTVDGVASTCPGPVPLEFEGTEYTTYAQLAAAVAAARGCAVTYVPSTDPTNPCTFEHEAGCLDTSTINFTTPPVAAPSYVTPTVNGGPRPCPLVFPLVYNSVTYGNTADIATQLSTERGCTITYVPSSDPTNPCTFEVPDGCSTAGINFTSPDPSVTAGPSAGSCDSAVAINSGNGPEISFTIANSDPSWTASFRADTRCIGAGCAGCDIDVEFRGPGPAFALIDSFSTVGGPDALTIMGGNLVGSGVYTVKIVGVDGGCPAGSQYCLDDLLRVNSTTPGIDLSS